MVSRNNTSYGRKLRDLPGDLVKNCLLWKLVCCKVVYHQFNGSNILGCEWLRSQPLQISLLRIPRLPSVFFFFLRILFRSYPTISVIRGRRRTFRRRKGASCKKTTAEEVRKKKKGMKRNATKSVMVLPSSYILNCFRPLRFTVVYFLHFGFKDVLDVGSFGRPTFICALIADSSQ